MCKVKHNITTRKWYILLNKLQSQLLSVTLLYCLPSRLLHLPGDVAHRPAHVAGAQHLAIVAYEVLVEIPLRLHAGFVCKIPLERHYY